MLLRILRVSALLLAAASAAVPVEINGNADAGAVDRYEERLEAISREVLEIERDLEALLGESRQQGATRVLLFLETPPAAWKATGVSVTVDGKTVFSRPFSPAELDVLDRGLPLELGDLMLLPGRHRVALTGRGGAPPEPAELSAEPGRLTSWVARGTQGGVRWRSE